MVWLLRMNCLLLTNGQPCQKKKRKFSTAGGMSTFSTKTTGDGQSFDSVMAFEYVSDSESDLDQIPQLPVSRFMQHFFQSV
jgi:hypothetical protein